MSQLPLDLSLQPHTSFAGFVAGPNTAAVEHVRAIADGRRGEFVWLCGPSNTGKSHLLAAACRWSGDHGLRAIYLPLASRTDPGLMSDLDDLDLVAIDDVDNAAGQSDAEAALFSLLNGRLQRGGVLLAASSTPRDSGFVLPDLVSRAAASAVYRMEFLGDDDLREAVILQAKLRGLRLDEPAASYLLQRASRDLGALTLCLDRIDRYALAAQRRLTIPLLREAMSA
jgi:DnaA family protein